MNHLEKKNMVVPIFPDTIDQFEIISQTFYWSNLIHNYILVNFCFLQKKVVFHWEKMW